MNALAPITWLFAKEKPGRPWWKVILWWEIRRPIYLLILTAFSVYVDHREYPNTDYFFTKILVISSNVWYTGGWLADLVVLGLFRDRLLWFAPIAFAAGIAISLAFSYYVLTFPFCC